jgi:hypothetical protein
MSTKPTKITKTTQKMSSVFLGDLCGLGGLRVVQRGGWYTL